MRPEFLRLLVLLLAGSAYYAAASPRTVWRLGLPKSARVEDIHLQDLAGKDWHLSQCRGRPVLLNVFFTQCPGTPDNVELMRVLHTRFKDTQLCLVSAVTDNEGWTTIKPWLEATKVPYPLYTVAQFPNSIWPNSQPAMLFIGRDGVVHTPLQAWTGNEEKIENWAIANLFDGSPESKIPMKAFTDTDPLIDQEYKQKDDVLTQAGRLLAARDFAGLDAMAAGLRERKERLPGGLWKLSSFYDGLAGDLDYAEETAWQSRLEVLNQWVQASSTSVTPRVALARVYVEYGWHARGHGYAYQVSEENARQFHDRLDKARGLLEDADNLPVKCPEYYHMLQRAGVGLGWEDEKFEALYRKAVAFEPDYEPFHFARGWDHEPQWGGSDEEVMRSAEEAAQATKDAEGLGMYTRVLWHMTVKAYYHSQDLFTGTPASWPKMRQGFLDIQKAYPSSYMNLNAFAHFACLAGDKETARKVFEQIGDHYDKELWGSPVGYMHWRRWSESAPTLKERLAAALHPPRFKS